MFVSIITIIPKQTRFAYSRLFVKYNTCIADFFILELQTENISKPALLLINFLI